MQLPGSALNIFFPVGPVLLLILLEITPQDRLILPFVLIVFFDNFIQLCVVSDYLRLLFPLPLASYSSCLGPFPISCSCLFVLTIFLVTYIWIKCLLLFAGWYLFSEI